MREAPARSLMYASFPELIPPTPINGIAPSTRRYISAKSDVDALKIGRPLNPPISSLFLLCRWFGLATVVFATNSPSNFNSSAVEAMCLRDSSSRSGAILIKSGIEPPLALAKPARRSCRVDISRMSLSLSCQARSPGVLGDDILTTR